MGGPGSGPRTHGTMGNGSLVQKVASAGGDTTHQKILEKANRLSKHARDRSMQIYSSNDKQYKRTSMDQHDELTSAHRVASQALHLAATAAEQSANGSIGDAHHSVLQGRADYHGKLADKHERMGGKLQADYEEKHLN